MWLFFGVLTGSLVFAYKNKFLNTLITNYINKVCNSYYFSSVSLYLKEKLKIPYLKQESRHTFSLVFFHDDKKYIIPLEKILSEDVYDVLNEKKESILEKYINHTAFIEEFRVKSLDEFPNIKYLVKVI